MDFHSQSKEDTEKTLKANSKRGLSQSEAKKRLQEYGLNELKATKKINPLTIFFRQFKSFIIYILLFAVIISMVAREYVDSAVILSILIFNAFFGFIQEYKAEKSIEALKKLTSLKVSVIRDGKEIEIDAKNIVPGDLMVLNEGDKVSADGRIIESHNLEILESSLTGESAPVSKTSDVLGNEVVLAERKNMVFSGTAVTKGRAKILITSTAMDTEIGKIAGLISGVEKEQTPLQRKLESLGKWIGLGVILISIAVFLFGIIKEGIIYLLFAGQYAEFILQAKDWFLTAVALAVAAVPEGLPAIVTIALALGVRKMLQKNSLIRRLPSIETLGEVSVICSDKTGTLTENEMTVRKAYISLKEADLTGEGYELEGSIKHDGKTLSLKDSLIFKIGTLCNNASLIKNPETSDIEVRGDPTEAALLVSAEKAGLDHKKLLSSWKRIDEDSFDSIRKMMSTVNQDPKTKKKYVFTKGAPEKVLEKCTRVMINGKIIRLRSDVLKKIIQKNEEFSKNALRVLGFAYKEYNPKSDMEENLIFVGLQGMIDPPRQEVKSSMEKCTKAGIRVMMVTGDNQHTAEAIAKEVGIKGASMIGSEFEKLSEKEQFKIIEKVSIFARVEPKHKLRIVEILQKKGNTVAMTGDGVNDAPALKKSDIGIAMGIKGTDVAKESSDMILQDENFTSIVNSVEEGRGIYENIKKFVNYLLSSNLAEVLVIFLAIILGWPLPMTAVMLLWINLVTDGLPALSLSVDPKPKNIMDRPPKKTKEGIMNKSMTFNIIYMSILITIAVLGLFYWAMIYYSGLNLSEDLFLQKIQTIAFTAIIVMELVRLQTIRSEYKLGVFSNKYLVAAVLTSILLQLAVVYTPLSTLFGTTTLSYLDWGMIVGAGIVVFIINIFGIKLKDKLFLNGK